jgi:hypothetical protein
MKHKFFKLTCVCLMTLVFGMKLASATPILLTFDWTGQCNDCQGPNGAIDVPGTNLSDTYYQDVFGLLEMYYYPNNDNSNNGDKFVIKSFEYYGSSIIKGRIFGPHSDRAAEVDAWVVGGKVVLSEFFGRGGALMYKGDFEDYRPIVEGSQTNVYSEFKSFNGGGWGVSCRMSGGLACDGGPIIDDGQWGDGGRGGGSRDVGGNSVFIMRGSLPLTQPVITTVPEPSLIAIFALGMLGLSLRRKKRT